MHSVLNVAYGDLQLVSQKLKTCWNPSREELMLGWKHHAAKILHVISSRLDLILGVVKMEGGAESIAVMCDEVLTVVKQLTLFCNNVLTRL